MTKRSTVKLIRDRSQTIGTAPGSLVFVGKRPAGDVRVSVIDYDRDSHAVIDVDTVDELVALKSTKTISWINVSGVHDVELVQAIGDRFDISTLTLEDVMNTTQRARVEEFDEYVYITIRMMGYDRDQKTVTLEQLSLILGDHWVISFQEQVGDVFESVRERLKSATGKIRNRGADYLAYALIDVIIDQYFVVLDELGAQIEELEEEVLSNPGPDFERRLYSLKRQLVLLRRSIWPSRELASSLLRSESPLIDPKTTPFLRDAYDHSVQIIDIVESFKDVVSNIGESYRSVVGNRMNEVMKVLTIIATIFIPLTFIAGIYGMNFEYMPELGWRWGYFAALASMGALGAGLGLFFKIKKWF